MNKRIKTGSKSPLLPAVVTEEPVKTKRKKKALEVVKVEVLAPTAVNVGLRLVPTSSGDGKSFTLYVSTGKATLQIPITPDQMGTLLTNDIIQVKAEALRPRQK
jgi:hypothetical protein